MSVRIIISGVILVILASMLVFTIEYYIPLSVKSDMNYACRNVLLKMEMEGGLKEDARNELIQKLQEKGFVNISVQGTSHAGQGEQLNLKVGADLSYSSLKKLFLRGECLQPMYYEKFCLSRRVLN